jgi:Flp pilus assembly pilin Flp
LTQQTDRFEPGHVRTDSDHQADGSSATEPRPLARLWLRLKDDAGAVAIEYVIVAIALLAIAGAVAAALTTLGNDAVENIPGSVSEVSS